MYNVFLTIPSVGTADSTLWYDCHRQSLDLQFAARSTTPYKGEPRAYHSTVCSGQRTWSAGSDSALRSFEEILLSTPGRGAQEWCVIHPEFVTYCQRPLAAGRGAQEWYDNCPEFVTNCLRGDPRRFSPKKQHSDGRKSVRVLFWWCGVVITGRWFLLPLRRS